MNEMPVSPNKCWLTLTERRPHLIPVISRSINEDNTHSHHSSHQSVLQCNNSLYPVQRILTSCHRIWIKFSINKFLHVGQCLVIMQYPTVAERVTAAGLIIETHHTSHITNHTLHQHQLAHLECSAGLEAGGRRFNYPPELL